MAEPTVTLADAVVALLNGQSWPISFTATRLWLPKWTLPELAELRVVVVPLVKSATRSSRISDSEELMFEVGVQRRLKDVTPAVVDPLCHLTDSIETTLRRELFDVRGQPAVWSETEFLTVAYPDHLLKQTFTAAFRMTYVWQRVHDS